MKTLLVLLLLILGFNLEAKHYSSEHKKWENKFINSKDYDAFIAINLLHNATNNSYTCKDVLHVQKEVKKAGYCKNTDFKFLENGFKQWAISEFGETAKKNYKDYFYIFEKVTVLNDHAELQGGYGNCLDRYKNEGVDIKSFKDKWFGACDKFIKYQSKLEKGNKLLVSQYNFSNSKMASNSESKSSTKNISSKETLKEELEYLKSTVLVKEHEKIYIDALNIAVNKKYEVTKDINCLQEGDISSMKIQEKVKTLCNSLKSPFKEFDDELSAVGLAKFTDQCLFMSGHEEIQPIRSDLQKELDKVEERCWAKDIENFKKEIDDIANSKTVYVFEGFETQNNMSYAELYLNLRRSRTDANRVWCTNNKGKSHYHCKGNYAVDTRTKRIREKEALIRERRHKTKVQVCESTFGGRKCTYEWR